MRNFPTQFIFNQSLTSLPFGLWLLPLLSWSLVWKGIALWKAGRNKQLYWFISLLILNTAGLLPILYLALFQNNLTSSKPTKKPVALNRKTVSTKKGKSQSK
jgi:hypothetical protein